MKEKQEELQEICSSHYEEFVGCMDNLLELRSDVTVLHNDLVTFEEELHSTGDELLQRSRRHVALLRISENMRLARSRIEECVAILHKTAQIQTSLDKKMHILALRQVEELQESSRLEEMSLGADGFEWAKFYAREVIPAIQMLVRQNAIDKFNEWLFTVRDCSPKVGRFALAQTALSQVSSKSLLRSLLIVCFSIYPLSEHHRCLESEKILQNVINSLSGGWMRST